MTGHDRTGQDRTGQDRTGQDRTGQDRTGYDVTGCDVYLHVGNIFLNAVYWDVRSLRVTARVPVSDTA
jgi:hypothetical protein